MSFLSPNIAIGTLRIGSIEGASVVSLGNNFPTGFQSYKKHNQGFGSINGDHNDIEGLRSQLSDSNIIDMINEASLNDDVPDWLKEIILDKVKEEDQQSIEDESS